VGRRPQGNLYLYHTSQIKRERLKKSANLARGLRANRANFHVRPSQARKRRLKDGTIRVPTIIVLPLRSRSLETLSEEGTMFRLSIVACLFVAAAWPTVALPGDKKKETKTLPGIEVKLHFSVEELDPLKPGDSYIECIVRNQSEKAVQAPLGYSSGFSQPTALYAEERHQLRMVLWGDKKQAEMKLLKVGEELVVFKESLKEVFLLEMRKEKPLLPKERRYYWTWQA
jgi:hypothetical protein